MSRILFSKFFALMCVMLFGISTSWAEDTTIYSWVSTGSDASGVTETGGTASGKIGGNTPNANVGQHYALQVAGDKAALLKTLDDHVTITLADGATFKSGDKVTVKGYYTKDSDKSVSLALLPGENNGGADGTNMTSVAGCLTFTDTDWPNLFSATTLYTREHTYELTAAYDGATKITLTRNSSGTTLFILELKITRAASGDGPTTDPEDPTDDPDINPAEAKLLWDYTEKAPTSNPDKGITYEQTVNDAAGTKNGLKGIKMNSSGYAYFTKAAVKGTLKLTFSPRDGSSETKLGVYSYSSTAKAETLIATTAGVTELQTISIDLTAQQNNIYINRASGAEGVLTKVEFVPFIPRTFTDFKINFTKSWASSSTITEGTTYYVTATDADGVPTFSSEVPADGKYLCTFKGRYHSTGYGVTGTPVFTVPVDGSVKIYYGMNDYGADITVKNNAAQTVLTGNSKGAKFEANPANVMSMVYAKGADVLTLTGGGYVPYFAVEACEVSPCTVTFKDQDGNVISTVDTFEGEALGEMPAEETITVPEGSAFRGWVYASGVKAKTTDVLNGNTTVKALVTPVETVTVGSVQTYNLTSNIFYPEDHETISIEGGYYHGNQHGWAVATDAKVSVEVAGNAQVILSLCKYGKDAPIVVTNAEGEEVGSIASAYNETDGALATLNYSGPATTLTFTFTQGESYLHKVIVYNVQQFLEKDAATGWYMVPANDAAALMLAINTANSETGATIFLPNGTYDLGEATGTTISGNNMSIIGESMEGTIIKNAPNVKSEGLGSADLIYNTSTGLYMQDLTLQNDLDYYAAGSAGRAAALQDNGNQTILRNVALRSYQDTYYSKSGNYYFEGGLIQGTVDYICGGGTAFFENITLLNKSRSKNGNTGDDTMTAYNGSGKYVFNNCSVESECSTFNFGRSWASAFVVFLNTTIKSGKLVDTRFSTADMNSAPRLFGEYNTVDLSGNGMNTPASKVLTTSKGASFESVLSYADAMAYTCDNVFADWDPKTIAAQAVADASDISAETLYLVEDNGEFVGIVKGSDINVSELIGKTIRKANGRGGFGEPVELEFSTVDVTIDEYKYITYYNAESGIKLPDDVYAKTVCHKEGSQTIAIANTYAPGDIVPAETPVILYSEKTGTYSLVLCNGGVAPQHNDLIGSAEDTDTGDLVPGNPDDYYYYSLSLNNDNEIGFYWMNAEGRAFCNGGGKAFLAIEKSTFANGSKVMGFSFNDDATAVKSILTLSDKVGKVYDVLGRKVKMPSKGLYIIDGKKFVK